MFRIIIAFCCILFYSCQENKNDDKLQASTSQEKDSIKLFSVIEKDSAYFISYQFSKQETRSGSPIYAYKINDETGFIILCDSASKNFKLIVNKKDTATLSFESDRFYTVNGKVYRVLKLVSEKGDTDGEVSYFFSTTFGLLLSKSNTWRIGKILNPEKGNSEFLQMTAVLYKVLTEEEFFKNPIPKSKIKFTPPKVLK